MADKRINALANTAPSTASDDFIAVDGTTNGTRKLNAFSPTFGGNATVTGTLTVNGVGESTFGGITRVNNGALVVSGSSAPSSGTGVELQHDGTTGRILSYNRTGAAGQLLTINHAGGNIELGSTATQVSVKGTTAATSTSTGALVVSGGVGVGGAINAGGDIATAATMRSIGFHVPGNGAGRPANTDSYLASTATTQIPLYVSGYTGGGQSADILRVSLNSSSDWFSVKGNGQVSCFATTASTSTSSGALVVSGGVGVAGAIFAGGNIQCNAVYASNNTTLYLRPQGATVSSGEAQLTTTGNLTLNGSVQTSAPAGGTAAAWKLGTIATVSPTSPNRTIEVDIGGTIYYIHAKTTNN